MRTSAFVFFIFSILFQPLSERAFSQQIVPLYSDAIPNSIAIKSNEIAGESGGIKIVRNISIPSMAAYFPDSANSVGSAVIIFPGGGYYLEAYEIEGRWIAEDFVKHGVAAFVVKYRLPTDSTMMDKSIGPLQDAQQAIKVVRENAGAWRIDARKVGIMGFSAGGHLASTAGTHFDRAFIPDKENISLRPDFMILGYPVISMTDKLGHTGSRNALLGEHPSDSLKDFFSGEKNVSKKTPPTFLIHAEDDNGVDPDNSIEFFEALRSNGVQAELLIVPSGGHGFAARVPMEKWGKPLFDWMRDNGWMK